MELDNLKVLKATVKWTRILEKYMECGGAERCRALALLVNSTTLLLNSEYFC